MLASISDGSEIVKDDATAIWRRCAGPAMGPGSQNDP